jgi:hypothetical protein
MWFESLFLQTANTKGFKFMVGLLLWSVLFMISLLRTRNFPSKVSSLVTPIPVALRIYVVQVLLLGVPFHGLVGKFPCVALELVTENVSKFRPYD